MLDEPHPIDAGILGLSRFSGYCQMGRLYELLKLS